jgi:hypothetical protein
MANAPMTVVETAEFLKQAARLMPDAEREELVASVFLFAASKGEFPRSLDFAAIVRLSTRYIEQQCSRLEARNSSIPKPLACPKKPMGVRRER